MQRNVVDILKEDHQVLARIMERIEGSLQNAEALDKLFQNFKKIYQEHTEAENEVVYAALKKFPDIALLIRKGYQAHHVVDVGVLELRLVPYTNETWGPKFLVMRDSILTHVNEEEEKLFPEVQRLLSEEELRQLGEEVQQLRQNHS